MKRSVDDALIDMLAAARTRPRSSSVAAAPSMRTESFNARPRTSWPNSAKRPRRFPTGVAARIPDVPWRAIRGMREKVVHDYPELDLEVVHAGR